MCGSVCYFVFEFDRFLSIHVLRKARILPVFDVHRAVIFTFQKCADHIQARIGIV